MSEYKSAVTLLLTVLAPSLLPRLLNVVSFLLNPSKRASLLSRHPLSLPEKVLVGLNTLWQLYRIFFPPFDLFITNRLSLLAPQHVLRSALYGRSPSTDSSAVEPLGDDHPLVELLLQKLSRPEGRTLYSRYGHETLFNCIWCTNKEDFALYSLAGIIGPYVFVAAVLGVLSLSSVSGRDSQRRTELWRAWFGWTLIVACTVEIGLKYNWDIKVTNRDGLHVSGCSSSSGPILLVSYRDIDGNHSSLLQPTFSDQSSSFASQFSTSSCPSHLRQKAHKTSFQPYRTL